MFFFFFHAADTDMTSKSWLYYCLRPLVPLLARCAAENTDLAEFGTGTCDYPCAGDESLVCGGYLSFTAYDVGKT